MNRARALTSGLIAGVLVWCLAVSSGAQTQGVNPQLQEARQAFEQLNFEGARDQLTVLISRLTQNAQDAPRGLLAAAYELRGRTLQNLRDVDGARADFRAMLALDPDYPFPLEAGARAVALFEEVRAAMVGTVDIAMTPPDADVQIDGRLVTGRPLRLALVAGVHAITAGRRGHASISQQFEVRAGEISMLTVTLERVSSSVTLQTSPANVAVVVDGTPRGVTQPAAPRAAGADTDAIEPSQPFTIDDIANGRHDIELRRDCYISERRQLDLQKPQGVNLDVIPLRPATGTIIVRADAAGATVLVDGTPRGEPTQTLTVCQGPHLVEVRTRAGRDLRRFEIQPGQKEEFAAVVRPAFALVSDNNLLKANSADDGRLRAEALFRATNTVTLIAPPGPRVDVITPDGLSALWKTLASANPAVDTQGLAAVTPDPMGDRQSALLALLAARSVRPDVFRWRIDDPASVQRVIAQLDALPVITRPSLGMLGLDVLDVQGVVVGTVEPGGAAAVAGVSPGEVITAAGGAPVMSAAALLSAAAAVPAGQPLSLDVRDRAGSIRRVDIAVQTMPRLLDPLDEGVLANTLAVALQPRTALPLPAIEAAATRMNLAVAWMRVGNNWDVAIRELEAADALTRDAPLAAASKDAIHANVQYLLGLCAAQSGDSTRAEQALTTAAQSPGRLLTEGGEPLKELAERRLSELRAAR